MNTLESFVRKIGDITNGSSELTIEQQRSVVTELNRLLFCTHENIGETTELEGEQFQYFSEYHKYWKENYEEILCLSTNDAQCEKVVDVLHGIYIQTEGLAFSEIYDTCGLNNDATFIVRILTANQDFNGSRVFSELAEIYKTNPQLFNPDTILEDPSGFISGINVSGLSQTDKRIDYAKNIASFVKRNGTTPDEMLASFNNDVSAFRNALISEKNTGYGNKKTDMFIRDMVQIGIWKDVSGFEFIDVASDVNTIKVAMRTGILKSEIPLVSSFMDIFCYQYGYIDSYSAKAWRRVWEIWKSKYPNECVESPCQIDYIIYNLIGRLICKESLTEYVCEDCGTSFYWKNSRKRTCNSCRSKNVKKNKNLTCANENGNLIIEGLATDTYEFLKDYDNCPFKHICNNGGNIKASAPKSISIKGQTGWTTAYANEENGGGGLMA